MLSIVVMVMMMLGSVFYMVVRVHVGVAFVRCPAKKSAYLVRCHIWYYFLSLVERVCNTIDIMRFHHA